MSKKTFTIICLIALIITGIYADSDTTWHYDNDIGLYHVTYDTAIVTEEGTEFPTEEYILVNFCKIGTDTYALFTFNEKFNLSDIGGITKVGYGDNLENLTDIFDVENSDVNIFNLSAKDSYYIYRDMISGTQKVFIFMNDKNDSKFVLFNINCDRLYRYSSYLY